MHRCDDLCGSPRHLLLSYVTDNRRVLMPVSVETRRRRNSWRRHRSVGTWFDMTTRERCHVAGTGSMSSNTCVRLAADKLTHMTPDNSVLVGVFLCLTDASRETARSLLVTFTNSIQFKKTKTCLSINIDVSVHMLHLANCKTDSAGLFCYE